MKRIKFLMGAIIALALFSSCRQNDDLSVSDTYVEKTLRLPEVTYYQNAKTLSFQNERERDEFVNYIAGLSGRDGAKLIETLGVNSFLSNFYKCKDRIDSLANTCCSKEVFLSEYLKVKDAAAAYALFMEDRVPVCSAKSLMDAILANANGVYLLNGQVESIERYQSSDDFLKNSNVVTLDVPISDECSSGLRVNKAWAETDDRKAIMSLWIDPKYKLVYIGCSAQKKGWFGIWDSYKTVIEGRLQITDLTIPFEFVEVNLPFIGVPIMAELEVDNGSDFIRPPFTLQPNSPAIVYIKTFETSEIDFVLGRFDLKNISPDSPLYGVRPSMKGRVEVWSRGISFDDRGRDDLDLNLGLD